MSHFNPYRETERSISKSHARQTHQRHCRAYRLNGPYRRKWQWKPPQMRMFSRKWNGRLLRLPRCMWYLCKWCRTYLSVRTFALLVLEVKYSLHICSRLCTLKRVVEVGTFLWERTKRVKLLSYWVVFCWIFSLHIFLFNSKCSSIKIIAHSTSTLAPHMHTLNLWPRWLIIFFMSQRSGKAGNRAALCKTS